MRISIYCTFLLNFVFCLIECILVLLFYVCRNLTVQNVAIRDPTFGYVCIVNVCKLAALINCPIIVQHTLRAIIMPVTSSSTVFTWIFPHNVPGVFSANVRSLWVGAAIVDDRLMSVKFCRQQKLTAEIVKQT